MPVAVVVVLAEVAHAVVLVAVVVVVAPLVRPPPCAPPVPAGSVAVALLERAAGGQSQSVVHLASQHALAQLERIHKAMHNIRYSMCLLLV